MHQRIFGSHREIYVTEAENWITQAYATMHHTFEKRRMVDCLTAEQVSGQWCEITEQQRLDFIAADATFERPEQYLIDMLEADPHGRWNEETGFGELNGVTDLTAADLRDIAYYGRRSVTDMLFSRNIEGVAPKLRTNLTPVNWGNINVGYWSFMCNGQTELEVFRLCETSKYGEQGSLISSSITSCAFMRCYKLHTIIGVIDCNATFIERPFERCYALVSIKWKRLSANLNLGDSPLISLESLQYLVDHSANGTKEITVTLHADAFARLSEELIDQAEAKNIIFAEA